MRAKISQCWFAVLFVLLGVVSIAGPADAHRTGESYLYFHVSDEELIGRFEITLDHLNMLVPLDEDGDGKVSKTEFEARVDEVFAAVAPRLKIITPDATHAVVIRNFSYLDLGFGTFAQLKFDIPTLGPTPEAIDLDYRIFFDGPDPMHRVYVLIDSNTRTGLEENESNHSLIIGPGEERQTLSLVGAAWTIVISEFIVHGIWHILIGLDHVLFVLVLLLPSVLMFRRDNEGVDGGVMQGGSVMALQTGRYGEGAAFQPALLYVAKVVTLFTIAHSITLSLAALNIVKLPATPVEVIIALSIAVLAFNNIKPIFADKSWIIVFAFGLFHGLGFANVLAPLGINQDNTVAALAGFNIGVELGQLAIILVVFPVLFMLRNTTFYRPVILRGGSALLIAIALFWFAERFHHGLTRIGVIG